MSERCPGAIPVRTHELLGWKLIFRHTADIEAAFGHTVYGGLYRIRLADELALDRFEGAPDGRYRRRYFRVSGEPVFTYMMNKPTPRQQPSPEYYQLIEEGYRDWNLPTDGLALARAHALGGTPAID